MKINDSQRVGSVNPAGKNRDVKSAYQKSKAKQQDQVQISPEALEMLNSVQGTQSTESIKKLNELKNAIATGTYHVDAGKIAEKLLPYLK